MGRAWARLKFSDGVLVDVYPGDIIGRLASAAVRINNPRISEIHALISLRGRRLMILAQRGLIQLNDQPCAEGPLQVGARITLVEGITATVLDVALPDTVLALSCTQHPALSVELSAPVYSLLPGATPRLLSSYLKGAAMHLWSDEDGWSVEIAGQPVQPVGDGDAWTVGGLSLALRSVPLAQAGSPQTRRTGRVAQTMTLIARYESVHIQRAGEPVAVISGIPARIITELVGFAAPTPWTLIADAIWPDETNDLRKRQNWDRTMRRLRARLRTVGLPTNLVRADGRGNVELVVRPGDEVIDDS